MSESVRENHTNKNRTNLEPEDVVFLKGRWNEALEEDANSKTIPADKVFAKTKRN